MPTWEYNLLRRSIDNGKVVRADTIAELATKIGVDSDTLRASVEQYSSNCDQGRDPLFFKQMDRYFPMRKPPFYAREVRACVIGQTGAGLNIDERAQVLDRHDRPIPGLYAGGEVLGCAVGKRYSGGGMGICNAMVFGRIAGQSAAQYARA
jgi:fumarate reductase flavoprotein subunit